MLRQKDLSRSKSIFASRRMVRAKPLASGEIINSRGKSDAFGTAPEIGKPSNPNAELS